MAHEWDLSKWIMVLLNAHCRVTWISNVSRRTWNTKRKMKPKHETITKTKTKPKTINGERHKKMTITIQGVDFRQCQLRNSSECRLYLQGDDNVMHNFEKIHNWKQQFRQNEWSDKIVMSLKMKFTIDLLKFNAFSFKWFFFCFRSSVDGQGENDQDGDDERVRADESFLFIDVEPIRTPLSAVLSVSAKE